MDPYFLVDTEFSQILISAFQLDRLFERYKERLYSELDKKEILLRENLDEILRAKDLEFEKRRQELDIIFSQRELDALRRAEEIVQKGRDECQATVDSERSRCIVEYDALREEMNVRLREADVDAQARIERLNIEAEERMKALREVCKLKENGMANFSIVLHASRRDKGRLFLHFLLNK